MPAFLPRSLPHGLESLTALALDLRWTWSHGTDALWQMLDKEGWQRTKNPWTLLQNVSLQRLQQLSRDKRFLKELDRLSAERTAYQAESGWYGEARKNLSIGRVAYFSMEFGLSEA
ncbi:Glycogen phosphorylase, partial [hydrothermal vent metagenome]